MSSPLVLKTTAMASGGRAVARDGNRVVFIEGALAGETVLARIDADKGKFLEAKVQQVLEPSSQRVEPRCRHFGRCGGCSWQHMSYPEQLRAKLSILEDSFARIGKLKAWPKIEVVSGSPWNTRNRTQFQPPLQSGKAWGFFEAASRNTVELQECPVLVEELQGAWDELAKITASPLANRRDRSTFAWGAQGRRWLAFPGQSSPDPAVAIVAGKPLNFSVRGFFQSHLGLTPDLVKAALGEASGDVAIDLYAGVGLFSVFLEQRFGAVHSVESDPLAALWAKTNLTSSRFHAESVEAWLGSKQAHAIHPDFVLVDPPRIGLSNLALAGILKLRPKRIHYVSCGHDTLSRDLRQLSSVGWTLEKVLLIDLYPHTPHLETVVHLIPEA